MVSDKKKNATDPFRRFTRLSAFDKLVAAVVAVLLTGIALVILIGDRVGVRLERVSPLENAHSTGSILLAFDTLMDRPSVEERLRIEPPVDGSFSWNGDTMLFRPAQSLIPGQQYTVALERGARSDAGRETLSEFQFSFTVMRPRVAFLFPADGAAQNVWIADPVDPSSARQFTFSTSGIYNFGVSSDGTRIAFAERNSNTGTSDIKMIDIDTGEFRQLTNCIDADCTTPVWQPNGNLIAYERVDFNSDLSSVGVSPTRVWLIDLNTSPASTRPLFADSQVLGYAPQWAGDGQRIAVFDNSSQGILIYDFTTGEVAVIPSRYGDVGAFSPDGRYMIFPEIILAEGQEARSSLQIANLETRQFSDLTPPDDVAIDDSAAAWRPDGLQLAVARRYLDERYTRGRQIYLVNPFEPETQATPLVVESRYSNGFFTWGPGGQSIVVQRFPELTEDGQPNPGGRPEIWTVDVTTGELTQIAVNAFYPRWIP